MRNNNIIKLALLFLLFQFFIVDTYSLNIQTEDSLKNSLEAEYPGGTQELFKFIYEKLKVENKDFEENIRTKMYLR